MQAPDIDPRSYDKIVAQTEQLAEELSGWKPPGGDGQPDGTDAGLALIRIFGRFAELVVQRLNRAPDKHYLAFLNLIGASPVPPRPARVPLTFQLSAESPVDAVVPARTLAGAPPQDTGQEEVVFETERSLVVTRAQLAAVYVSDPTADTYSNRFAQATGAEDKPFEVFSADQQSPHQLYLACDPLLTQPGVKDVTLRLASPDPARWLALPVSWAFWDGDAWRPVPGASSEPDGGSVRVALPSVPALTLSTAGTFEAGWLRAELGLPLPHPVGGEALDAVAVGSQDVQEPQFPLTLFPASSTQRFYLSADRAFDIEGARAVLRVRLATPGAGTGVQLTWSYQDAVQWQELGQSSQSSGQVGPSKFGFRDGTLAFTTDGEVSFRLPHPWPVTLYRNHLGRWLKVEVTGGQYGTDNRPEAAEITAGYDWEPLPELGAIVAECRPGSPDEAQPAPAAFCNSAPVDMSKPFYPLGQQPAFNDTCYIACPDDLAWPGAKITLNVSLVANPAHPDPDLEIAWEISDGIRWHDIPVPASPAPPVYTLTGSGDVAVTLPAPLGRTSVNGDERYWLRARLVSGGYGHPDEYKPDGKGGWALDPATLDPPVIKTVAFTAAAGDHLQAPVTACLSYNNFAYTDRTAAATKPDGQFSPFEPAQDADPALYLGFDPAPGERLVTVFLDVQPPLPEEVAAEPLTEASLADPARIAWEYASGASWAPLGAADETQTLSRPGLVTFVGPPEKARGSAFGRDLTWLRARWQEGVFPLPPRLRRVLPATTWAAQVTTVANETLGSSSGDPGQSFVTAQTPVQPGEQVVVGETQLPPPLEAQAVVMAEEAGATAVTASTEGQPAQTWVSWQAVPDFYDSGPRDRHYTLDPLSGELRFGDGAHGMIPPPGQNNIRISYRTGGGEQGNREAGTVVELKSSVPYIDSVTNHVPAQGGAPAEPVERVKARGPHVLRHRGRAVAAEDLEDLALAASADVARAAAIVPLFNPGDLWIDPGEGPRQAHKDAHAGRMGVVIVPGDIRAARPVPSLGLLLEADQYLRSRCPPTAALWVAGPEWIAVDVTAQLAVSSPEAADPVRDRAGAALAQFLHPLAGGPRGQGWEFGRWPRASLLSALLEGLDGVDHLVSLEVSYRPDTADEGLRMKLVEILEWQLTVKPMPPEVAPDVWHWLDRSLVYSGRPQISVGLMPAADQTGRTADADPAA
jgi:hypothetical protein